jgi:hypothetical protein
MYFKNVHGSPSEAELPLDVAAKIDGIIEASFSWFS